MIILGRDLRTTKGRENAKILKAVCQVHRPLPKLLYEYMHFSSRVSLVFEESIGDKGNNPEAVVSLSGVNIEFSLQYLLSMGS